MEYIGSLKQDIRNKVNGLEDGGQEFLNSKDVPKPPPATVLDNFPDTNINPYEFMGIERTATEDEVKRAYRKGALRWHPDKHPPEQKAKAQKTFQRLTTAYAVLSDPVRREIYDTTGRIHDSLHMDENDPWRWQPFYQQCWNKMAKGDIEAFAKEYRHSAEEKDDLLKAYTTHKGDMNKIYEHVVLSNVLEDDTRYRKMIQEAIDSGDVKSYKAFAKESAQSKKSRLDMATSEAREAEQARKELQAKGKWFDPPSDDDAEKLLAISIRAKNQRQNNDFLANLLDKYGPKPGKKKGKKGIALPDEPSEEDFQKNSKQGFAEAMKRDKERERQKSSASRKRKAEPVVEVAEEEEEEDVHPVKKWNRLRKKAKQDQEDEDEEQFEQLKRRAKPQKGDPKPNVDTSSGEEGGITDSEIPAEDIWGKPLTKRAATAAAKAKNKPAAKSAKSTTTSEAKAAPKAKAVPKAKAASKPKTSSRGKRAIVESDHEDDRIELGSQDSDEDGDD